MVIDFAKDLPQHVQDKIHKCADGCWEWMGGRDKDGYGRTKVGGRAGRTRFVHRFVYEQLVGPIAKPTLDHLCRNRACCRPSHLAPATMRENLMAPGSQAFVKLHKDKVCCSKCGGAYTRQKDGTRTCRRCRAARERARKAANRDRINAHTREWWAANRNHINGARRARRAAKQERAT